MSDRTFLSWPAGWRKALPWGLLSGVVVAGVLTSAEALRSGRHMELADRTLDDRFREAAAEGRPGIPPEESLRLFGQAADALDYLNRPRQEPGGPTQQGIQHRDIKPQNLLLVGDTLEIGDFGLARCLENSVTSHTGSHTPANVAPEFFDGKATSQSDQYSLAVTWCALRGGRLPFQGSGAQVMAGHLHNDPDLSPLPAGERYPVLRALSKHPKGRWPSCKEFVAALRVDFLVIPEFGVTKGVNG